MRPPTDLEGRTFGKLTVAGMLAERSNDGRVMYLCVCECGKQKQVRAAELLRGRTQSCGCLQKQRTREMLKGRG